MLSINSGLTKGILSDDKDSSTSYLDHGVWANLSSAEKIEDFAQQWLSLQCSMLIGIQSGIVIYDTSYSKGYPTIGGRSKDKGEILEKIASWPSETHYISELYRSAEIAINKQKPVVKKLVSNLDGQSFTFFHLAFPFIVNERCIGTVVLQVEEAQEQKITALMRQIQWGCAWFEVFEQRRTERNIVEVNRKLEALSRLVASYVDYQQYSLAATAVLNELASELECERVSLGFTNRGRINVDAISNSTKIDKKTNLLRAIQESMQETADQQRSIHYPHNDELGIKLKHKDLYEIARIGSVLSVPILEQDKEASETSVKVNGVLLFEHQNADFFKPDRREYCEQIGCLVGPLLSIKKRQSRNVFQVAFDAIGALMDGVIGPRYLLGKLILMSLILVFSAASIFTTTYKVNADAVLEGWVQRTIAAPQDGFIQRVQHRPGDIVAEGDLLFQLDDKELRLELLRWQSEKLKINQEYLGAFSSHDKTEVGILKARLAQVEANLSLVESQIRKTQARAPFEGVVLSGDLSQSLGSPVHKGDVLMQVAPLNKYRVILNVDEKQIREVALGQEGRLVLSSMPEQSFNFTINRLAPMADAVDGANVFKVEAQLEQHYDWLRPGMQGAGKIEIGERSYLWIMSRNFMIWLKLWLWSSRI